MSRRPLHIGVPPTRRSRAGWRWIASTSFVGGFWGLFAAANFEQWSATRQPVGAGAVAVECLAVVLFVARREPLTVSRSPLAWIAAALGGFGLSAARPSYAPVGDLEFVYQGLQIGGALTAVFALLTLGRSFGVVAANRGVETRGPYRIVRHPVYASYLVVEAGYLFENPSVWNVLVLNIVMVAQVIRILHEERTLSADPEYAAYRKRVPYRLVPYVL